MKIKSHKTAIYLAIAMSFGLVTFTEAQSAEPTTQTTPASPGSGGFGPPSEPGPEAAVPSPSAASDQPEEVIVTARRVEERAQDVPISMSIFSQQQLSDRNISSGGDLATYTPGLQINSEFGSDNTSFAIRGFNQQIGTSASVAVYFADVVAPRGGAAGVNTGDGGGPGSYFDLHNVQVLKGPQGTLFGRNTDGGAILLVPQKPTSELGGYVDASYGNYNMWRVQGVLNIPVADNFRLRFGIDHESRDGYMKNKSGIGPSDFNDIGFTSARASSIWNISSDLENYTILSYTNSDHNGSAQHLFACSSSVALGPLFACPQLADQGGGFWTTENDLPFAHTRVRQIQAINTTTWSESDNLTIKNIASYAQLAVTQYQDLFGTAFSWSTSPINAFLGLPGSTPPLQFTNVVSAPGHHLTDESTTTEEIRLQGHFFDNRLTWQSGAYAEFNEPIQPSGVTSGTTITCADQLQLECTDYLGALSPQGMGSAGTVDYQVGNTRFHDFGLYEQSSYSLTEKLALTEGFRYTIDSAESNSIDGVYRFPLPNMAPVDANSANAARATPQLYCENTTTGHAYNTSEPYSVNAASAATSLSDCFVHLKQSSSAPTWTIGLDYKLFQDVMAYGKYTRGYRQGSVNATAPEGAQTWNPEKVDSFELGTKTSFETDNVHGTFNLTGFYNNFRDQQLSEAFICPVSNPQCGAQPNQGIVNAGRSTIWGVEVESTLSPYKGFTIATSYEYNNARLKSITPVTLPASSPYAAFPNVSPGDELPLVPKNKISTTASYVIPLDRGLGKIRAALGYTYTSGELQSTFAATPYYKTQSYGLTSGNLDWIAVGGSQFDVGFFVNNLFDQRYVLFRGGTFNSTGFESETVGEPRMFGGHLRMNFDM